MRSLRMWAALFFTVSLLCIVLFIKSCLVKKREVKLNIVLSGKN